LNKRLNTSNTRKTTVRTFQIALERGRCGGIIMGGGGGGVRMTGGGGGGGLPGGVSADSGVGGSSSIMSKACHKPRRRASANTTRFQNGGRNSELNIRPGQSNIASYGARLILPRSMMKAAPPC
jgi:hypothetical protein